VEFEGGHILNTNLDTYLIPTAADMPPMTVEFVEEALPFGPFGAKNVAEPSMVATAPAILNAIYQASGRRARHLPANLERVLLGRDLRDSVVPVCAGDMCERARCEVGAAAMLSTAPASAMISVSVRYQGRLADQAGRAIELISLPAGSTVKELHARACELHPAMRQTAPAPDMAPTGSMRWFINGQPAQWDNLLSDGAEATLLPLTGGG